MKIPQDVLPGTHHSTNNFGTLVIRKYINARCIEVEFVDTGFTTTARADHIRNGMVKDYIRPIICGIGYLGVGKHSSRVNSVKTRCYQAWLNMIKRCYSDLIRSKNPTYADCTVCPEWHNFQNYAAWYYENEIPGFDVDKDILIDGNREYSPGACSFVSKRDNSVKAKAKFYRLKDPEGNIHDIYNMSEFCRNNGLSSGNVHKLFRGIITNHKGWTRD